MNRVKELGERYRSELPENMDITFAFDRSYWVKSRLGTMVKSGALGLVLVVILLGLFLESRAAFIAALEFPSRFSGP